MCDTVVWDNPWAHERLRPDGTPWGMARMRGRRHTGFLKTYSPVSAWGFIVCDAIEQDVFVHMKWFDEPPHEHVDHSKGMHIRVAFDLDYSDKKRPKAHRVVLLGEEDSGRRERSRERSPPRLVARGRGSSLDRRGRSGCSPHKIRTGADLLEKLQSLKRAAGDGKPRFKAGPSAVRRLPAWRSPRRRSRSRSRRRSRSRDWGRGRGSPRRRDQPSRSGDWKEVPTSLDMSGEWKTGRCHFRILLPKAVALALRSARGTEIGRKTAVTFNVQSDRFRKTDSYLLTANATSGENLRDFCTEVVAELEKYHTSAEHPCFRVQVILERWTASVVIGFKGMNVKSINFETGSHLSIETGERGDVDQIANITGESSAILAAFARVHAAMHQRSGTSPGWEWEGSGRDSEKGGPSGRPPSPPPPWSLQEHPSAPGEWYFLNEDTGETTWILPGDASGDVGPASPPPPWKLEEHPEAPGEFYYLNEETGETTWELPDEKALGEPHTGSEDAGNKCDLDGINIAELIDEAKAQVNREMEQRSGEPPTPPYPWVSVEHPDEPGTFYFLNEETGETAWELPPDVDVGSKDRSRST